MDIIEITGSPCSGKSTLLESINILENNLSVQTIYGNPYAKNNILYLNIQKLFFCFLGFYVTSNPLRKFLLGKIYASESHFIHQFRLVLQTFLKFGRQSYLSKKISDKSLIVDEGISHIPFNLFLTESDISIFISLLPNEYKKIKVYCLFESEALLYARLEKRGHKRVVNNEMAIKDFIKKNNAVYNLIGIKYKHFFENYGESNSAAIKNFERFILPANSK
jgi:AAA15 family ATPase/GTPase